MTLRIDDPAYTDTTGETLVDRCLLVRTENPNHPLTDPLDPDSDGDGLLDGKEGTPEAWWYEAEDFAPAAQVLSDDQSSNGKHIQPAADSSLIAVDIAQEYAVENGDYEVWVRAKAGAAALDKDAKVGVHVTLGGLDVLGTSGSPDEIDVTVIDPRANLAVNHFVWRSTEKFTVGSTGGLRIGLTVRGANGSTVRLDKVALVKMEFKPVWADGALGWVYFTAPRHLVDPMDPDTDLDGYRSVPPPNPPGGWKAGSEGYLTDGHEIEFGMNPLEMDTDYDLVPDSIDFNPLSADSDGDGLLDGMEDLNLNGVYDPPNDYTNSTCNDTDGDGILDGNEDANMNGAYDPDKGETNATDQDLDLDGQPDGFDTDLDGLPDGLEIGLAAPQSPRIGWPPGKPDPFKPDLDPGTKTNPRLKDTDGDGLDDGVEDGNRNGRWDPALGETDPARYDTDGDGLGDGAEVNTYHTNPNLKDTDGDGLSDGEEVRIGTDPFVKDTDGDGLWDGEEVSPGVDGFITDP